MNEKQIAGGREGEEQTHKHGLPTSSEVGLQEYAEALVELRSIHLRSQIPVKEVPDSLALQRPLEQKPC